MTIVPYKGIFDANSADQDQTRHLIMVYTAGIMFTAISLELYQNTSDTPKIINGLHYVIEI